MKEGGEERKVAREVFGIERRTKSISGREMRGKRERESGSCFTPGGF